MSPVALGMAERYRFTARTSGDAPCWPTLGGGLLVVWTQTVLAVGARVAGAPWFGVEIASRYRLLTAALLQDLDWNYAIYLCIVGVSHAVYFHRQAQDRAVRASQLEARLAEAQLQALQRQLQPHFLFNTLHAIFTLVRHNPAAAEQMIERLSELLRVTLKNTATQEVPLAEELTYLDKYLAIEKVHFGDRLQIEMDVPLGVQDGLVPYLVLQPLVENAIRHGLAPRRAPGTPARERPARRRSPRAGRLRQRRRRVERAPADAQQRRRPGQHARAARAALRRPATSCRSTRRQPAALP